MIFDLASGGIATAVAEIWQWQAYVRAMGIHCVLPPFDAKLFKLVQLQPQFVRRYAAEL